MSDAAYYVPVPRPTTPTGPVDDVEIAVFRPTEYTVSTWGPHLQHGAPPSALLARAIDRHRPRPDTRLSRLTVELLGPVPLTDLEVRTHIERPGRRIELVVAELWATAPDGTDRPVARGTGWRLETIDLPQVARTSETPLPAPDHFEATAPHVFWKGGYIDTVEWRIIVPFGAPGLSSAWVRSEIALVEGETPSGLDRLMSVADVANGVGSKLDPREYTFLNTELTVHLFRAPEFREQDWVGIAAEMSVGPDGVGMTAGLLYDETGALGRIAQNVQVRSR
ncbi:MULTISPECIES: thioesterase family protein [Rhodococcus]|uniref:Thioesterase n=1 Tax=Rhodococcus pyridinivorans SB3094 TaxID=1435356 RepID=V9X8Z1_9NOCA|nr:MULTISPECIES: thioesterase family protein [Rhodococcus]AHD19906.1 thioesterase [Rhodococcus pyridinivorans SB3094]MCT7289459.1 thioesterase family protein [Rhodococcus sp. PAE-6]USI88367.1 thioesterase family protein [Rhodococcus pyridinivorans]